MNEGWVASFNDGVMEVLSKWERQVFDAKHWLYGVEWFEELDINPMSPEAKKFHSDQQAALVQMEMSLYQCIYKLLALAGGAGGIEVYPDGDMLFWQVRNGLHGGMVFHAKHYQGHRLPVGDWSLHT